MALALADAGADVVVGERPDRMALAEKVATEVSGHGRLGGVVALDVRQSDDCTRGTAAAAEILGSVDILVNNAGIRIAKPALETTEEDFDSTLAVNLKGVFFCSVAAAQQMIPVSYGRIINIASTSQPPATRVTQKKRTPPAFPTDLKSRPLPTRKELGDGVGESPERVTNQNEAMIGPKSMTPRQARWTPIEKSIHTAIETTTPCQASVSNPVKNPPSGPIRYERSSVSRRSRLHSILANFGPNRAVDRPNDIVVKGLTAMPMRISHLTADQEQQPTQEAEDDLRLDRKETS